MSLLLDKMKPQNGIYAIKMAFVSSEVAKKLFDERKMAMTRIKSLLVWIESHLKLKNMANE